MKKLFLASALLIASYMGLATFNTQQASAAYGEFRLYNSSKSQNWVAYKDSTGYVRRLEPGQDSWKRRTKSVYIPKGCYGYIVADYSMSVKYAPGGQYTYIQVGSFFFDASAQVQVYC